MRLFLKPFTARACSHALAVALCMSLGFGATAHASRGERGDTEELYQSLQRVPERVNFIVGIPEGAPVLGEIAGQGEGLNVIADTLERASGAWKALAEALDWKGEDLTVALLGGTVVLVGRSEGVSAELTEWTLRCTVTPQTEARLMQRLELLPRHIVEGQPVFSIENGRYVLALRRGTSPDAEHAPESARSIQLFVAPAEDLALKLFALALRGAGQGEPLPDGPLSNPAPAIESVKTLGKAWAVLLVRDAPDEGPVPDTYAGWGTHRVVAFQGSQTDSEFRVRIRDHRLIGMPERIPAISARSLAPWWTPAAAVFLLCESPSMPRDLQAWTMGLMGELPLDHVGGTTARLTLWSAAARDDGPGLTVHAALQAAADIPSARALDGAIEGIVSSIESLAGAKSQSWEAVHGLCQVAPLAVRQVRVSLPARGYGAQIAGAESVLQWGVVSTPPAARLGRGWDGWLIASMGPDGADLPEPPSGAVMDSDDAKRWICRATLRFPQLLKALPSVMPMALKQTGWIARLGREEMTALGDSMGAMDELTFESWLPESEPGIALASLRIRLDPVKAAAVQQLRAGKPR